MTENKADKALRKVTVNFINHPDTNCGSSDDSMTSVDISAYLPDRCYFHSIDVTRDEKLVETIYFISRGDYEHFRREVENILDATIVNTKQRDSIQRLLTKAFLSCASARPMI